MSSPIQNCSEMENNGGEISASPLRNQQRKKRKLVRREYTEDPESKLEVAPLNVDMITQSSIQDNPITDLGTSATVQLSKHEVRRNGKLLRDDAENPESKPEVARRPFRIITPSAIQDNPNNDLGTTATVKLSKRQIRRNRKLLEREDTENPESKPEVARENVDMIKRSSMQDNANTDLGSTATVELSKRQERRKRKLLKREDTENHVSKLEVAPQNLDMITQLSIQDNANTDLDTTATVELSKREERRNRKLLKEKNMKTAISETVSSGTAIIYANTGSKREEYMGTASGETGSGKIATLDAKMVSEGEEHIKVSNGVMGSNICKNEHVDGTIEKKKKKSKRKKSTLGESLSPQHLEDMEVANGEMGSNICENDHLEGTIEKKKKKKSTLGESLSPQQLEDMEVANGEMGSTICENDHVGGTIEKKKKKKSKRKKSTLGESLSPQHLEDMEVANGEMGSNLCENDHVEGTIEKKKKKKSTLGESLSPQQLEEMEVANGEMGSTICENDHVGGTIEKTKKKKSKRKKSTLGESSSPQQLEDMEVADGEMGSNICDNDHVEGTIEKKRQKKSILGENLSPQQLEDMEVANGEMGSNICENDHVEGTIEKKKKKKSKRKKSTLGESLSPQQLEDMEVANGEMGSNICENDHVEGTIEKKEKKESKRKKSNLDEILNPQQLEDMEVAKKDRSTKVLEPDSKRSPEKKKQKLKKKAAKGELLTANENTQDSIIAKKDAVLEAETVSKVEECTSISRKTEKLIKKKGDEGVKAIDVIPRFPTSGKKLVVFDVNGLLVDIVSPPPWDVEADIYIPKRAIFKRPFLDGFLHFCFERFHVGIWSSRTKKVLDPVVNYVLGDLKKKLLFLWDATSCTSSGMKTLEDRYKPMVFKDLRKIWEKNGPGNSWVKGTYNESNTLLFDDSPYKALLNPKHSGIFPVSYSYKNKNDNLLGPTGLLRTYLEGVAATDDLKMYVEQHPFGQDFIDENNRNWSFYSRVLKSRHY